MSSAMAGLCLGEVLRVATRELTSELSRELASDGLQEARILMAHVLGLSRTQFLALAQDYEITPAQNRAFQTALDKRKDFQPIAQIIGKREFWGRSFKVTPDVLDPRADSELLIERALAHYLNKPAPRRILDLGLGTGCLLFTLLCEFPNARGIGVDISAPALAIAQQNAEALGVSDRAELLQGDWFAPLKTLKTPARFDLIISNPPYIAESEKTNLPPDVAKWEPPVALFADADGLANYQLIAEQAADFLNPNGTLILEIGATQGGAVSNLFTPSAWQNPRLHKDLNGHNRVFTATKP